MDYTRSKQEWNSHFVEWSEGSFQAMGRYVAENSEPGAVAVFQDMGGAPWTSPDVRWVDTIGILSGFVGKELAAIELNPFMRAQRRARPGGRAAIQRFERRVRDYCFDQDPQWIAFIAYISKPERKRREFGRRVAKAVAAGESVETLFAPRLKANSHAHGIYSDPRFARDYEIVQHWKRNEGYWVVLFKKKDGGPGADL